MIRSSRTLLVIMALLPACSTLNDKGTLGSLRDVHLKLEDERVTGTLESAMESYKKFLEDTPESALTPEAMRRLADLKLEKDYGTYTEDNEPEQGGAVESQPASVTTATTPVDTPTPSVHTSGATGIDASGIDASGIGASAIAAIGAETAEQFERRATRAVAVQSAPSEPVDLPGDASALQAASAKEAIALYRRLLAQYPNYERNDQVLYQLSRAYEETGQIDQAMEVLTRLVAEYPDSRHIDEAQFRRAEYFFVHKRYLDAEEAYRAILDMGTASAFYELALYKQAWAYYKQELYEEALDDFIALLDYKISIGYDFEQTTSEIEKKRVDDTYRAISLSFSNLGGPEAIAEYFDRTGHRDYEAGIYSHLGEHYLEKRRYADAARSYNTFIERNPLDKVSPHFHIRIIEIFKQGGFPRLVVEEKKRFATTYALAGTYWTYFDINAYPDVLAYLKSNLVDLANHFHAQYRNKRLENVKQENYREATHWYRAFLDSFPEDAQAVAMNYQLADLLLENRDFLAAALEYERTSYNYPRHERSAEAGHAAVYAYREYLKAAPEAEQGKVRNELIRSSLRFAETYPDHDKAPVVLVSAIEDLYGLQDYERALLNARKMLAAYPGADPELLGATWLVIAHASFAKSAYADAEEGYAHVLELKKTDGDERKKLIENLAASIYKQGEEALKLQDYQAAADHFLRVATAAPSATIRPNAEYDAAAALISARDWKRAASVLTEFRDRYPGHELQPEVTKKLAAVYSADDKPLLAAAEFERIEKEVGDESLRREALQQAAELYEKASAVDRALAVYQRFVAAFTKPVELVIESRQKIADIYLSRSETEKYRRELKEIIDADHKAGSERTDRTRYLASKAALVMAEASLTKYREIKLVKPFKKNLNRKKKAMKAAIATYTDLLDYEVGEVTAAVGYEIAEIYYDFSRALMNSERPGKLSDLEREQYDLAIEEQAYPFEEKAIKLHEKNVTLIDVGIYNDWVDKSLARLAVLMPARYAKAEISSDYVSTFN